MQRQILPDRRRTQRVCVRQMHGRGLLSADHDGHCKGASQGTAYTGRRSPCRRTFPHMGAQAAGGFEGISYDTRYRSKKPLIVITNLTLNEIKNPCDLVRSRIYDRIFEVCVPLKISSQNIRTINCGANFKEAGNILSHPENDTNVT